MPLGSCYCLRLPPVGPTNQRPVFWVKMGESGIAVYLYTLNLPSLQFFFYLELFSKASSVQPLVFSSPSKMLPIRCPKINAILFPLRNRIQFWLALCFFLTLWFAAAKYAFTLLCKGASIKYVYRNLWYNGPPPPCTQNH